MNKRTAAVLGIGVVMLAGCASNSADVARHDATHEWIPTDRLASLHFEKNERSCVSAADTIEAYEVCMADRGYKLDTP